MGDNKGTFLIMIVIVVVAIIDSSVVGIATSTGGMRSSLSDIAFFTIMVLIFAVGQFILLGFIRSQYWVKTKLPSIVKPHVYWIDRIARFVQYALLAILVSVIFQIAFTSSYYIYSLTFAILITYGFSIFVLTLLAKRFFLWYRINRSIVVLFYGLAVLLITINAAIAIVYLGVGFSDNPVLVKSIRSLTGSFALPDIIFGSLYTLSSILSFAITWIATVFLLKHYSKKLGKIKYWIVVAIPLAYFLSQFQSLFLFTFADFRLSDPVLFGIIYTLLFSLSKPLGGVLFGVAFWIVASSLKDSKVKEYLITSGFGITLLFASNQPLPLILVPYPPFGLVTVCFAGLASYLIYLGIYSSAISVSEDARLRRTIRMQTLKESQRFLEAIGSAEMEQEIQRRVLTVSKKTKFIMENETGVSSSLSEEEMRNYLTEVLDELRERSPNQGKLDQ